ncbi:MAG: CoA-transferase subunit beta [Candidatus Dormibacteria bacterium]
MTDPGARPNPSTATAAERIAVTTARLLPDRSVCFVGIGLPGTAALLAQRTTAPASVLIYESGAVGARPTRLPLSIGDGELAETAQLVVPMAEIFNYWLQGGRVDIGLLGAAQVDRFGNLNTTVIGEYGRPRVRLPGAGGAPEIATSAARVVVLVRHSTRTLVERVDFLTTRTARPARASSLPRLAAVGRHQPTVVTDLGVLRFEPLVGELVLHAVHEGVSVADLVAATGWPLRCAERVEVTETPSSAELTIVRELTNPVAG